MNVIEIRQKIIASHVHDNAMCDSDVVAEYEKLSKFEKQIICKDMLRVMLMGMFLQDVLSLKDIRASDDFTISEKDYYYAHFWSDSPNKEQYMRFYKEYNVSPEKFVRSYLKYGIQEFDPRFDEAMKFYIN